MTLSSLLGLSHDSARFNEIHQIFGGESSHDLLDSATKLAYEQMAESITAQLVNAHGNPSDFVVTEADSPQVLLEELADGGTLSYEDVLVGSYQQYVNSGNWIRDVASLFPAEVKGKVKDELWQTYGLFQHEIADAPDAETKHRRVKAALNWAIQAEAYGRMGVVATASFHLNGYETDRKFISYSYARPEISDDAPVVLVYGGTFGSVGHYNPLIAKTALERGANDEDGFQVVFVDDPSGHVSDGYEGRAHGWGHPSSPGAFRYDSLAQFRSIVAAYGLKDRDYSVVAHSFGAVRLRAALIGGGTQMPKPEGVHLLEAGEAHRIYRGPFGSTFSPFYHLVFRLGIIGGNEEDVEYTDFSNWHNAKTVDGLVGSPAERDPQVAEQLQTAWYWDQPVTTIGHAMLIQDSHATKREFETLVGASFAANPGMGSVNFFLYHASPDVSPIDAQVALQRSADFYQTAAASGVAHFYGEGVDDVSQFAEDLGYKVVTSQGGEPVFHGMQASGAVQEDVIKNLRADHLD